MKIGIYDPYLDDVGGGEKYMMSIAECLSQEHEVTVFWDNKRDIDTIIERFSLNLSGVRFSKNIFASQTGFLKRIFNSIGFDIIIFLSDGSIPFLLSRKTFIHLQQPLKHFPEHFLKDRIKLLRISGVFCNSIYTKSFNEKRIEVPTVVIYPPVEFKQKNIKKENIILTVGRFRVKNVRNVDDYKKLLVMIESFKSMNKKRIKGWRFVLATSVKKEDGEKFEDLKKSIKGYPIKFLVNMSNDDLWNIYSRAKIYWHAAGYGEDLEKHPEYAEHFGISTVEAMGAGVVPVVINAGGQKEIITDSENGFLWDSTDDLVGKTQQLINDRALWEKMSLNAKQSIQKFSKERFCHEIQKLIRQ